MNRVQMFFICIKIYERTFKSHENNFEIESKSQLILFMLSDN